MKYFYLATASLVFCATCAGNPLPPHPPPPPPPPSSTNAAVLPPPPSLNLPSLPPIPMLILPPPPPLDDLSVKNSEEISKKNLEKQKQKAEQEKAEKERMENDQKIVNAFKASLPSELSEKDKDSVLEIMGLWMLDTDPKQYLSKPEMEKLKDSLSEYQATLEKIMLVIKSYIEDRLKELLDKKKKEKEEKIKKLLPENLTTEQTNEVLKVFEKLITEEYTQNNEETQKLLNIENLHLNPEQKNKIMAEIQRWFDENPDKKGPSKGIQDVSPYVLHRLEEMMHLLSGGVVSILDIKSKDAVNNLRLLGDLLRFHKVEKTNTKHFEAIKNKLAEVFADYNIQPQGGQYSYSGGGDGFGGNNNVSYKNKDIKASMKDQETDLKLQATKKAEQEKINKALEEYNKPIPEDNIEIKELNIEWDENNKEKQKEAIMSLIKEIGINDLGAEAKVDNIEEMSCKSQYTTCLYKIGNYIFKDFTKKGDYEKYKKLLKNSVLNEYKKKDNKNSIHVVLPEVLIKTKDGAHHFYISKIAQGKSLSGHISGMRVKQNKELQTEIPKLFKKLGQSIAMFHKTITQIYNQKAHNKEMKLENITLNDLASFKHGDYNFSNIWFDENTQQFSYIDCADLKIPDVTYRDGVFFERFMGLIKEIPSLFLKSNIDYVTNEAETAWMQNYLQKGLIPTQEGVREIIKDWPE